MKEINVLDEAQLRSEFNKIYKEIGSEGMLQVLYELVISVQICCEVFKENLENERD